MTPQLLSIINQSTRVTDSEVTSMAQALGLQYAQHVSPIWGRTPAVEAVPTGGTPTLGGTPAYIIDVPDVPDALGYHSEDASGPFIKVFVNPVLDNGGTTLVGSLSVSAVLSHEGCELLGDPSANRWADGPSSNDYAIELSDPIQGDFYDVTLDSGVIVSLSNFVYPDYFDPNTFPNTKLDYLGKLSLPFTMSPGGYLIVRTEPGNVSQIFGHLLPGHTFEHLNPLNSSGVGIVFGPAVPGWKKAGILAKYRKTGRRKARR